MDSNTLDVFAERLWTPVAWWVVALVFAVIFGIAVLFFLGPWWGAGVAVGCSAVVVAVLLGYGLTRVTVTEAGVQVGRSLLEWPYVADVTTLDTQALRDRLGPSADRRAYLAVRPYIHTGIELTLDDPADPHPYWLVTTRHPQRLAAAVRRRQLRGQAAPPHTDA